MSYLLSTSPDGSEPETWEAMTIEDIVWEYCAYRGYGPGDVVTVWISDDDGETWSKVTVIPYMHYDITVEVI